jgi:uncharacterized protein (TIGR03067 family)
MSRFQALSAVVCVALVASLGFTEDKPAEKFDASKLVGEWMIESGIKNGEKADTSNFKDPIVFTKDKITMKTPEATFEFSYKIDQKKSPVAIDLEITSETFQGTKSEGIIKFDGDKLVLCYNAMPSEDSKRPTTFDAKADSACYCFTMKKAEKKDK